MSDPHVRAPDPHMDCTSGRCWPYYHHREDRPCPAATAVAQADLDKFEQKVLSMLSPKDVATAVARRKERDQLDGEALLSIVVRHHEGLVEGLTEDDLRTLTTVAYRLHRGEQ